MTMEDFEDRNEDRKPVKLDFSRGASRGPGDVKKSPINGGNRAAKLRLFSLVGLLLLVIVAMKEAGKPERWMWLGFDEPAQTEFVKDHDIGADDIVLQTKGMKADAGGQGGEPNGDLGFMPDRVADQFAESVSGLKGQSETDNMNSGTTSSALQQKQDPQKTPEAIDFWRSAFLKLTNSQQEAFYELLRRIDASQISPPENLQAELPFDDTIRKLKELQENSQAKALSYLSGMSIGDRKTKQTERLFAFDESWRQHVLPALEASVAGEDFTMADQAAIRSVRSTIDPIVMQDVEDMTGIGNPGDKLAWRAIWDFAQRDGETNQKNAQTETTLLQLSGQPAAFRNQAVSITGTALTIRRKTLKRTMLHLDHYFELWIDPPSRINDGLVCVYVAALPNGFEDALDSSGKNSLDKKPPGKDPSAAVTEQFQTIKIPVSVNGRFFKIRSYQDAGKSVSHCPVVIAETFTADLQPVTSTAAASWRPSVMTVLAFFVVAGIAAIAIAFAVYQSTQSSSKTANKPTSNRVARSLDALTDDDSVMTDAQRVSQLNEQLEEDFS